MNKTSGTAGGVPQQTRPSVNKSTESPREMRLGRALRLVWSAEERIEYLLNEMPEEDECFEGERRRAAEELKEALTALDAQEETK